MDFSDIYGKLKPILQKIAGLEGQVAMTCIRKVPTIRRLGVSPEAERALSPERLWRLGHRSALRGP